MARRAENRRGNKPFQQVVIPAAALASREPEKPRVSVRLEYRADDVRLRSEPVRVRTVATLEIERRQRPIRTDPFEDVLRDLRILLENTRLLCGSTAP